MKRIPLTVIGLMLATAAVAAQQAPGTQQPPATPGVAPDVQILQRRFQFQLMESVIVNAVRQGASEVAARAQGSMPIGMLFMGMPKARGFPIEHFGVVFYIEIPQILESAVLLDQFQRPTLGAPSTVGNQSVANPGGGKTRATRVVEDDPMAKSPLAVDPFLADPNKFYRETVKAKLVDAILDYSKSLEIGPTEWLSLVARSEDDPVPSLYREHKAMILRIKGSDLAAYYTGKITKDEARKLVIESQF